MARISCEQRHQNEEQKSVKTGDNVLGVGGEYYSGLGCCFKCQPQAASKSQILHIDLEELVESLYL